MAEDLQKDTSLTIEILKSEPDLFTSSPLSSDRRFILANINSIPSLAAHMSPTLKTDASFIKELCEASSPELAKQILEEANLNSSYNEMSDEIDVSSTLVNAAVVAAIAEDVSNMNLLTKEQKNDYNLLKEVSKDNNEVIDYVVKHVEEYGSEGLKAVKENVKDIILDTGMERVSQKIEKTPN